MLFSIFTTFLLGCNSYVDQEKTDKMLKANISGDWVEIIENENSTNIAPPPPSNPLPEGMTITNDSIVLYWVFSLLISSKR